MTKLTKVFSREKALFYFCVWSESDIRGTKHFIGKPFRNAIYLLHPNKLGEVWYPEKENRQLLRIARNKVNESQSLRKKILKNLIGSWNKIEKYLDGKKRLGTFPEMLAYFENLAAFWSSMNAILFNLPNDPKISPAFKDGILNMRSRTEQYTDQMNLNFVEFFERKFPRLKQFSRFVTPEEANRLAKSRDAALIKKLEQRRRVGCFLLNRRIYLLPDLEKILKKNRIVLEKHTHINTHKVQGTPAYPGNVSGTVKVVMTKADIGKVRSGDILVSPMTNPEYLPAMRKARAFVTDEGGITCHAAIVSREMKKPCVVGTKIATKIFKDGMRVEVDATKGMVTIISKS